MQHLLLIVRRWLEFFYCCFVWGGGEVSPGNITSVYVCLICFIAGFRRGVWGAFQTAQWGKFLFASHLPFALTCFPSVCPHSCPPFSLCSFVCLHSCPSFPLPLYLFRPHFCPSFCPHLYPYFPSLLPFLLPLLVFTLFCPSLSPYSGLHFPPSFCSRALWPFLVFPFLSTFCPSCCPHFWPSFCPNF